ncbi:hypothetical protein MRB53_035318 [Persea americana]|uniref:Uncharacterized protein n=1 Tax=Persea americana TaxID=3435 RepID=A0ACC2K4E0_PERAE|nr:hypothetical protein MRB53_035318 [Persea americana]
MDNIREYTYPDVNLGDDTDKHFSYPTNEMASEKNASPEEYNDDIDFNDDLDDVLNQDESDSDRNSAGTSHDFVRCGNGLSYQQEVLECNKHQSNTMQKMLLSSGPGLNSAVYNKTKSINTKREISLLAGEGKKTAQARCQSEMRKTNQTASAILIDAKSIDKRRTHFGSDCSSLEKKQGSGVQALVQVKNKMGERER